MTLFGAMQAVVCEAGRVEVREGEGRHAGDGWGRRIDSAPVPTHSSNVRTNTLRTKEGEPPCWRSR